MTGCLFNQLVYCMAIFTNKTSEDISGLAQNPGFIIKPNPAGFTGFMRVGFLGFMRVL